MYDVIVIGARAAGAPTAMLLARKGYKVLLVDRLHYPGDSSLANLVQLKGCAALKRWGLLQQVQASNCPPVSQALLQVRRYFLQGEYPPLDGLHQTFCPRRTLLDKILVDAALESGVELREDLVVEGLLTECERVTGIRGRLKSTSALAELQVQETAHVVIGADGKHSLVADAVRAAEYQVRPALSCAYYTYWEGIGPAKAELYYLDREAIGLWPTNDGQIVIFAAYPADEFQAIRGNIEARFWKTVECVPGLAERLRSGRRVERFYGTADLPSFYRRPYGPGWALVGDAGMTIDPLTGQGIGNAFRDAERLVEALDDSLSGRMAFETALARYENERNVDTLPMYELTGGLVAFGPTPGVQQALLAALMNEKNGASWVLGALSGSVPVNELFSPASLLRIIGLKGMFQLLSPISKFANHDLEQ